MNIVVDFNELRLLVVVVVLAADICYQAKDFNRAVYFYDQAVHLFVFRNWLPKSLGLLKLLLSPWLAYQKSALTWDLQGFRSNF